MYSNDLSQFCNIDIYIKEQVLVFVVNWTKWFMSIIVVNL